MKKGINAKDLINIGLFTAIYFVVFFATGMLGYIPIMMLAMPVLCPLVAGIPFMLFLTRVHTFGMVSIMGVILSLLMVLTGHPWQLIPVGIVMAVLGDLVLLAGEYRGWRSIRLGYVVFSEWLAGLFIPFFFMRDHYFAGIRAGYGDAYADTLMALTPPWVLVLMIALIVVGALGGAYLGKAALKKHFKRAGIT
jgi:energy-coupling factor transport system substrate-specific component